MTTLEECNTLIAEYRTAWYAITGHRYAEQTGEHLFRFRQLPPKERAYYAALVAPFVDPDEATRTQTISEPDEYGRRTIIHDPPLLRPCACKSPAFRGGFNRHSRCSRCLHAWTNDRDQPDEAPSLQLPLVESVKRSDMGHAIERMGK